MQTAMLPLVAGRISRSESSGPNRETASRHTFMDQRLKNGISATGDVGKASSDKPTFRDLWPKDLRVCERYKILDNLHMAETTQVGSESEYDVQRPLVPFGKQSRAH